DQWRPHDGGPTAAATGPADGRRSGRPPAPADDGRPRIETGCAEEGAVMSAARGLRVQLLLWGFVFGCAAPVLAQAQGSDVSAAAAEEPGGERDFDFEFGTWTVKLKRLV